MAKKEWSKSEIVDLISIYEEKSILWDTKDTEYRNREKKAKVLEEIAEYFECSAEEIQRKIHNLRNQMSQELRKNKKKKGGSGTDDSYLCNWPYFRSLKFLIPILSSSPKHSSNRKAAVSIAEKATEQQEISSENEERRKEKSPEPKRRKRELDDDNLYRLAFKSLRKEPDDFEKFGQYVALELKSLKSDFNRSKLKSEIRKVIVRIADEELNDSVSSTSTCTQTASPLLQEIKKFE